MSEISFEDLSEAMVETFTPKIELIDPTTLAFRTRRAQHLPCFLLDTHSVNEDFRGREDILKLLAAKLLPSTNKVAASTPTLRQFALCGFGGIGKTEIAREFVRRHLSYFDAVFWVKADEVANLDLGYKRISLALRLEEEFECKSRVVSNEIVKRWLSNPLDDSWMRKNVDPFVPTQQATWLLVFDNANDPTILADYWPQGSGSILVTSRDPLAKSMFTNRCSGLDIDPFSQQDSLSLINNLTGMANELEDDTARKISDALGGIPLAISQMAGIIRRWGLTLAEFLELYNDDEERSKLYRTKFDTHLVPYCHSLSTVWAFDKLRDDARLLLEVISFFDSDVIREDLLIEASAMLLPEHSQFKKWHYIEARTDLLQASLIHRDKQKQSLSVHRTVQDVMFARISLAKKRFMFDLVVRILWENWPSAMPKPSKKPKLPQPKAIGSRLHVGRWPICAVAYPHVLKIHRLWSTIPGLSEATKLIFAKLLLEAAWYQNERGRVKQFNDLLDTARSIYKSSTHPDRDSLLADIDFCLRDIAVDTSDFDRSIDYKEIDNLRKMQGAWGESVSYHQRAYNHMRGTVSDENPDTANAAQKVTEHLISLSQNEQAI